MSKTKKVKCTIPESEIRQASIFFAIGNLAVEFVYDQVKDRSTGKVNLNRAWDQAENILISETGVSGEEERQDWEKTIRQGSVYCNEEWEKSKSRFL